MYFYTIFRYYCICRYMVCSLYSVYIAFKADITLYIVHIQNIHVVVVYLDKERYNMTYQHLQLVRICFQWIPVSKFYTLHCIETGLTFNNPLPAIANSDPPAFFRSHVHRTSSDSFWQQTILALGHLVGKAFANMSWTCVSKCGDPNIVHFWLKVKTAGIAVLWGDVQKGQTLHSCRCCDLLQLRCSFCIQKLQVDRGDGNEIGQKRQR